MYKILIAPDSFKGTLTAQEVCDIVGKAFEDTYKNIEITKLPVADGGEGLCSCLHNICGGKYIDVVVAGVFGKPMTASYLLLNDGTAVIETASCAGLPLAGDSKNPELATTRGVGELILHAADSGAKSILLGLGGSATNDCGIGMAEALGYSFLDSDGNNVNPVGLNLSRIEKIIPPDKLFNLPVIAACDVDNPLFGETGAAYVFAPQKGADPDMVKRLDSGLKHIASVIKRDLSKDISQLKGAGAAGGLGAGSVTFLNAKLMRGIDIILDKADFSSKAAGADIIITGEGRLDSQSVNGKVISGVAGRSAELGIPVITICGCRGDGAEAILRLGVSQMFFCSKAPRPFEDVLKTCRLDLYNAAKEAADIYVKNEIG